MDVKKSNEEILLIKNINAPIGSTNVDESVGRLERTILHESRERLIEICKTLINQ